MQCKVSHLSATLIQFFRHVSIFPPYSITSIREYFGNGFEEYLRGDAKYLKNISPTLYNKIEELLEME